MHTNWEIKLCAKLDEFVELRHSPCREREEKVRRRLVLRRGLPPLSTVPFFCRRSTSSIVVVVVVGECMYTDILLSFGRKKLGKSACFLIKI